MNKLLIALPILALLSVGAVFMIAHHKKSSTEEATAETNSLTIDTWQHCFQSLPVKICDDLKDATELSACYAAANANSQYVWDGATSELAACVSYYAYFKASQSGAELNYNNYYHDCFLNGDAVNAAQKSDYFYNQIYKPKFITCAGY